VHSFGISRRLVSGCRFWDLFPKGRDCAGGKWKASRRSEAWGKSGKPKAESRGGEAGDQSAAALPFSGFWREAGMVDWRKLAGGN
jgi:hypothetical protein